MYIIETANHDVGYKQKGKLPFFIPAPLLPPPVSSF